MHYLKKLQNYVDCGQIPVKYAAIFQQFADSYFQALPPGSERAGIEKLFTQFVEFIGHNCQHPFHFELYHRMIRKPFDYHQFGLDLIRPLIDLSSSTIPHFARWQQLQSQLMQQENAILFANHQTEIDPQIISLLLEKHCPHLVENLIFVAGERVLNDPMAIPLSMGCNLLCIYSRKYIDTPPEGKRDKQMHNQRTMKLMSQLLQEGGKCIYVAPSGGRDRPNAKGIVEVAPFDPDSIEMFRLMASHAAKTTRFYPLALATYDLLPPPNTLQTELGETRRTKRCPVHLSLGEECSLELTEKLKSLDKTTRRQVLCQIVFEKVASDYALLP